MNMREMLDMLHVCGMYSERQWLIIGRKVREQIPAHEFQPFIDWLKHNDDMHGLYMRFPGEAVRKWQDSTERYLLDDPTKVSEGL